MHHRELTILNFRAKRSEFLLNLRTKTIAGNAMLYSILVVVFVLIFWTNFKLNGICKIRKIIFELLRTYKCIYCNLPGHKYNYTNNFVDVADRAGKVWSYDIGSTRTLVTLLRPWIRRFTMIISAWWLRTTANYGQEFEKLRRNIGSQEALTQVRLRPKHEVVTAAIKWANHPIVSVWLCPVTEG